MRRLLLVPLVICLCAASRPPQVTLSPDPPLLGRPLTLDFVLDDPDRLLAGLPALGSFELLAPPRIVDGKLHLLLLPMRPGLQTFPPLPLQGGATAGARTPSLQLQVEEGLAADATAAPLLATPAATPAGHRGWRLAVALLAVAGAVLLVARRRRNPRTQPPAVTPDAHLAALQRRLQPLLATSAAARALDRQLQQLRFGPAATPAGEPERLAAAVAALCGDAP